MTENGDWHQGFHNFQLSYCTTPHTNTNIAPADLFLQHHTSNDIPQHHTFKSKTNNKDLTKVDTIYKQKNKSYTDNKRHTQPKTFEVGNKVLVKWPNQSKTTSFYDNKPYTVIENHKRSSTKQWRYIFISDLTTQSQYHM